MIREVVQVAKLASGRAIIFGENWNATISGDQTCIDWLADACPGVLVDVLLPPKAAA